MSDLALTTALPRQTASVPANRIKDGKRTWISRKLKAALDAMVWNDDVTAKPLPWLEAARKAGFSAVAMRQALERPHVQAYLRAQRQVFRTSICASNLSRLTEIRDQNGNMNAAVSAVKLLEQMDDPEHARGSAAPFGGITVQIINSTQEMKAPNQAQVIDNVEGEER